MRDEPTDVQKTYFFLYIQIHLKEQLHEREVESRKNYMF